MVSQDTIQTGHCRCGSRYVNAILKCVELSFGTRHWLNHRKQEVQPHTGTPRVRLLTIWFGANDACLPEFTQHVPLSRFSENLATMVHAIRAPESSCYSPETRVLLITPPPIHVPSMGVDMQSTRTFEVTKAYAEEVKKVGEAENVPVVDAWTGVWKAAGKSKEGVKGFLTDGLHLSKAGYEVSVTSGIVFFTSGWMGDPGTGRVCCPGRCNKTALPRNIPRKSPEYLSTMGILPHPHPRGVQGRELARVEK